MENLADYRRIIRAVGCRTSRADSCKTATALTSVETSRKQGPPPSAVLGADRFRRMRRTLYCLPAPGQPSSGTMIGWASPATIVCG
jgi:hypothetical protein